MNVELTLLGPIAAKQHIRMGLTLRDNVNDFQRHALIIQSGLCMAEGCLAEPVAHQHGWCCAAHDPLSQPRKASK